MSAGIVRAFLPVLRKVESELTVPLPERVRILRELEYDLEQLQVRFEAQGLTPEAARDRALEALAPDGISLQALDHVHAPLYRRLTRRLNGNRLQAIERSALGLATAFVVITGTVTLTRADLLRDPSPFLLPVLLLGGLLFALTVAKTFELWIKRDHTVPGRGLGRILGVAGVTLAVGFVGTVIDFYRLAAVLESDPAGAATLVPLWLVRDAALLSLSLLLAMAGGLAWFILSQWLAAVSDARRDVLGLTRIPHHSIVENPS
jgi:hypothetical protein